MDYGDYSTTSYGAQGGAGGGGFMPGSQSDSPGGKKAYGKDTLRPVTIKQLLDAQMPNPTTESFLIDDAEATQITVVGQIRNVSSQTTNITYKLDDGTGIMEAKVWVDQDSVPQDPNESGLKEEAYARVYGKLKEFNNKRHIISTTVRPITDPNEINYHLLESTVVHLHFTRGPPGQQDKATGSGGGGGGMQMNGHGQSGAGQDPQLPQCSSAARKVYDLIKHAKQGAEGLHVQMIASEANLELGQVMRAGEELQGHGLIYTTVDDDTWAILEA
ncbi:replication protein A, subunit RPA32 [Polychaeton citri CBS 116435]|uniref:Replication protein A, subunit RPA32 n=1 Tax=Polychaeton citri CBS 116435 TaxID=1314669 RepID=A0A9P4Q1Y2_9PEZI|nr:replication protein A, subunit RPA32 [Polychaeton citri CBS 116435]